ncbi:MAG: hypothetical protein K9G58_14190 [Bacteroidales bacterium]|nr:hypothetical protein [Bacteroidales bacterium]MCF8399321.1 hypothetical protein [Bacteroidales bacterium]
MSNFRNLKNGKQKGAVSEKFWLVLDNAAKIFPALLNEEFTAVFRLSAVLKHPVRIHALFKAVALIEKRFPYYKVQLKKGFFWYYLEHIPLKFNVEVDNKRPCRSFSRDSLMIRILVSGNKINLEFSHILTDGSGAFEFLKSILLLYSKETGHEIPSSFEYLKPADPISEEEYEDAYKRYFKEKIPPMVKKSKAFHLPFPLKSKPRFEIMNALVSVKDIKSKAKEKNVSINDYLVSVYLFVLQEINKELKDTKKTKSKKCIRIQVPADMRKIFPSKTMRNFSLFVMPEIDLRLGEYSFDEIVKFVYHQIRLETDEKLINKTISRNVGGEKKIYVKSMPLFLKSLTLRLKYYSLGANQYSGVLTNLGMVKLPPETENLIDHFVFTPPPPNKLLKVSCGIIGFDDKLLISFGNISKSKMLEDKFFQFLKDQGIRLLFMNEKK